MPKRRTILVVLALGILAGLIFAFPRLGEPSYKGTRLTTWLHRYSRLETDQAAAERIEAIQKIGPKGVPYLLKALRHEEHPWLKNLEHQMHRIGLDGSRVHIWSAPEPKLWIEACEGFRVLGPQARGAIPELVSLLRRSPSAFHAEVVASALGGIGEPALVALLSETTNATPRVLRAVMFGLASMGTNAAPAIPVLMPHTEAQDPTVATAAIHAFIAIRNDGALTTAVLTNALHHHDALVRTYAAKSLGQFGEQARALAIALRPSLNDPDPRCREVATNALRAIAPEALTNAPPAKSP